MLNLFIGLFIMFVGFTIVAKSEWMLNNFGSIAWFDQHLGMDGGSRLGYKLVGLLFLFIGFLFITGMISGFVAWMVSPLTRYSMPQ
jgi:hypothetical protein